MATSSPSEITAEQILYGRRLPAMQAEQAAGLQAGLRIGSRELKLLNYLAGYHDPTHPGHKHFIHTSILKADVSSGALASLKRMVEKGWIEQDSTGGMTSSWTITPEGYALWEQQGV